MATRAQISLQNDTFLSMVEAGGAMQKQAENDANDYIRYQLREESFSRKILPPVDVGNDFDRALWTDKPIKIYDKESPIPQSVVVGYSNNPINFYIHPSRFAVTPTMIISPKVQKNKWELRTYSYDVRQVFADNMVKDIQAMEDYALLQSVNAAMIGVNTAMPTSGIAQWVSIAGGFSRNSVVTATQQTVQSTRFSIPVETALINHITWAERNRWGRDEAGGDLSQDLLQRPYASHAFLDTNWLVTIKKGLVATMTQYMFGPTKFLGKSCQFTPPTMYSKMETMGIYQFQVAEEIGTTLAHFGAFGRADYLPA